LLGGFDVVGSHLRRVTFVLQRHARALEIRRRVIDDQFG
jgi:hypothetical protein